MPDDVPAAAQFKVTFCSHPAPGSSVPSRLGIHLSLGRNHSFRSKCTHPSSGRTASLLAAPARGVRAGRGGRAQGRRVEVPLSLPRAHRPGGSRRSRASLTSDLARLPPSRWARRALRSRGLDFARAASPPPPARVGPQRRLPPPPGREPRAAGAAPAARRASSAGQAR